MSLFTGTETDTERIAGLGGEGTIHKPERFLSGTYRVLNPVEAELLQDEVEMAGEPTTIKLDSLVPTEDGQSVERVRGLVEHESYTSGELSVYRLDGKNLLLDGHHRAIAASLDGQKSLPAQMVKS
jgi:hypothetical protein